MSKITAKSIHPSTEEMYARTREKGISTVFERFEEQEPVCGFGRNGICCQLCSHGPCRISPFEKGAKRGICGADADTIVARNLVRLAVHGAAAYSHHLEEVCATLIAAARGETVFAIADPEKLKLVATAMGLSVEGKGSAQLAVELAEAVLADLRGPSRKPSAIVEKLAPESRKAAWRKLDLVPGGLLSEIRDALTKSMTSINTDPVDLLATALRLGIGTGFVGLVGTVTLQDILLGTPQITTVEADLGIIDPNCVNIVAHGHVPLMGTAVLKALEKEELQGLAREAGAKGIKVYGSMCTGQELAQRNSHNGAHFAGQTGNWINQEFLVATGAVDLVMMDMNCSIPGLKEVARRFHTRLVSVDRVVRMPGVSETVDYDPLKVKEQAEHLVRMAVEAYRRRGDDIKIPAYKSGAVAGFSVESILGALGGSLDPLINLIKEGKIRGIAAVVGCTNNRNGHDTMGVTLTRELIKRDILVINSGCMSSAMQIEGLMSPGAAACCGSGLQEVCAALGIPPCLNFGSCLDIGRIGVAVLAIAEQLGVDPSALPVAASAPEYLEQKAVADGIFAAAMGLLTHLAPVPPVTGSSLVTKVLTEDLESLVGGRFLVETDPVKAAAAIEAHIEAKRAALGLPSNRNVAAVAG